MKAARAGHLQTVQFLVSKGADVNRHTTNNDHTVLSLASTGGHISVVQYLLLKGALSSHQLRVRVCVPVSVCLCQCFCVCVCV